MTEYIDISTGPHLEVPFMGLIATIRRQEIGDDGGVSIELLVANGEQRDKLIRFDVFRADPHYHLPSSDQNQRSIESGSMQQSLDFVYRSLTSQLPDLFIQAGFADIATQIIVDDMPAVVIDIQKAVANVPEPNDTNRYELTDELKRALGIAQ